MMNLVYEVLARKKPGDPMQIIGAVNAQTARLAVVYACQTYNEVHYCDMKIVPRNEIVDVYSKSKLVEG
jgi:1,2-phenylacetyl-CoA epoxidase PaaB subunit